MFFLSRICSLFVFLYIDFTSLMCKTWLRPNNLHWVKDLHLVFTSSIFLLLIQLFKFYFHKLKSCFIYPLIYFSIFVVLAYPFVKICYWDQNLFPYLDNYNNFSISISSPLKLFYIQFLARKVIASNVSQSRILFRWTLCVVI